MQQGHLYGHLVFDMNWNLLKERSSPNLQNWNQTRVQNRIIFSQIVWINQSLMKAKIWSTSSPEYSANSWIVTNWCGSFFSFNFISFITLQPYLALRPVINWMSFGKMQIRFGVFILYPYSTHTLPMLFS